MSDNTTPEEPRENFKTHSESLVDHSDLYNLVKVLGLATDAIADSRSNSIAFITPTIKKSFTFTKTGGGYDLRMETPESVELR